jgi:hypothetical protein
MLLIFEYYYYKDKMVVAVLITHSRNLLATSGAANPLSILCKYCHD